jgi:hypothetical protein
VIRVILVKTAIFFPVSNINRLVFIIETECVFFAVGLSLTIIQIDFCFKRDI